jgi:hypothetical protein
LVLENPLLSTYIQAMKNIFLSHWKRNYVYGEEFDVFFCFLLHEEGEEFDAGYATFEQNMSGLC